MNTKFRFEKMKTTLQIFPLSPVCSICTEYAIRVAHCWQSVVLSNQAGSMRLEASRTAPLRSWPRIHTFLTLKPGSHMPPTYLGHGRRHGLGQRCGICEHLSPTHNLSQALTAGRGEFNFAGKPAVVGDENILCEHHLTQNMA